MRHGISAVKTARYEPDALREAVRRHFDALCARELIRPGARVLLKPNLLMRRAPGTATTTHPLLVEAVALELQSLGAGRIVLADSPGGPYAGALLQAVYQGCGMADMAGRCGIELNYDLQTRSVPCALPDPLCRSFDILAPVLDADVVVNIPKLKTHSMMTYSGAVKNLFGCVPGLQKPELHFRFPEPSLFGRMLVELAETVKPQLTIVDAVTAMEGDGPSAGTPRDFGWTFAARDTHALDFALCALVGIDPSRVQTLVHAGARGLLDFAEPVFIPDGKPEAAKPFRLPRTDRQLDFTTSLGPLGKIAGRLGRRFMALRPVVAKRRCIGCGRCAESCPAKTIAIANGKAVIDYGRCIKCYCCHELCPVRAIAIRRL